MEIFENEGLVATFFGATTVGTVRVRYVVRNREGRLVYGGMDIAAGGGNLVFSAVAAVPPGSLLAISAQVTGGTIGWGQARIACHLQRLPFALDGVPRLVFDKPLSDTVLADWSLSQGGGVVSEGGAVQTLGGANPGAGAEFIFTPGGIAVTELVFVHLTLITDATVVNRLVGLNILGSATVLGNLRSAGVQPASQTINYRWANGMSGGAFVSAVNTMNLPRTSLGTLGWRTNTLNIQAGDAFSEIAFGLRFRLLLALQ